MINAIHGIANKQVPWTPAAIASAVHWYRVRNLSGFSNNDPIGTLPDLIGSADLTSTSSARPLLKTNAGDPYLLFDGVDDTLTATIAALGDATIIFIMEFTADGGYDALYASQFMWANSGGSAQFQPFSPVSQFVGGYSRSFPSGDLAVFIKRETDQLTVRMNGSEHTGTVATTVGNTFLGISANYMSAGYTNIKVKELIVCNDGISGGDFTNLAAYILSEYGLTL